MRKNYVTLISLLFIAFFAKAQTDTLPYHAFNYTNRYASVTLNNLTTCQSSVSLVANTGTWDGWNWGTGYYNVTVNGTSIGQYYSSQTINLNAYLPITSVQVTSTHNFWCWVDARLDVSSNSSSMPATGPSVSNITYCQNATAVPLTATLTGTGTTLKWYTSAIGDNYRATAPTPSTATLGTISYWVAQAVSNGCESKRSKIDVIINAPASPTVTPSVSYFQCTMTSPLTATGDNLKWYTVATGGTSNANAPTPSTSTVGVTSYWVSQTNANGCESSRAKIDVIINIPTAPTVTPSVSYFQCSTASSLTATGDNLKWYTVATGGTSDANAPTPSTSTVGTTSYWVSQTNANGCESERAKIDVIINIPTAPTVTPSVSYCQNAAATALTAIGDNLKWYTTATGGTGSATAPTPSTLTVNTTSYWVSQTNANGCESERGVISVIIKPLPTVSAGTAPTPTCLGTQINLVGTASANVNTSFSGLYAPANWTYLTG